MINAIIPAFVNKSKVSHLQNILSAPLLLWSIRSAQECKKIDSVYVLTDDESTAALAVKSDAKLWPGSFGESTPQNLLQLAKNLLKCNSNETIVFLNPYFPIRHQKTISTAIDFFQLEALQGLYANYNFAQGSTENGNQFDKPQDLMLSLETFKTAPGTDVSKTVNTDWNFCIWNQAVFKSEKEEKVFLHPFQISKAEQFGIHDDLDLVATEAVLQRELSTQRVKHPYSAALKKIKLIASDLDGIWTDAGMYYSENGEELKKFNSLDGMGVRILMEAGIKMAIVTGENTPMLRQRAKKLKVDLLFQDLEDKLSCLKKLAKDLGIQGDEIAYIGDDINDLEAMGFCGFVATVPHAVESVQKIAHYHTRKEGGGGALREFIDLVLRAKNG